MSFDNWGIDFFDPIEPSSHGKSYILVCTNYATKWIEAQAMTHAKDHKVTDFLYECIFTRFGVPREIVRDQGAQFTSNLIVELMKKYMIHHGTSSSYHSQANGQVEITNREIEEFLNKIVSIHKWDWVTWLLEAIWAYQTRWKSTTRFTPFELLYGKFASMPIKFDHKTLKTTLELDVDLSKAQEDRLL